MYDINIFAKTLYIKKHRAHFDYITAINA